MSVEGEFKVAEMERIEALKKHIGVNPRPMDFDEYWDKAIEEMRHTESACTLIPAKFHRRWWCKNLCKGFKT